MTMLDIWGFGSLAAPFAPNPMFLVRYDIDEG
jgi:hypothetical protein